MKNPLGWTPDERRRLMAGEMSDIERRRVLARSMSWWTEKPGRMAEALIEKADALGLSVLDYLRRPISEHLQ